MDWSIAYPPITARYGRKDFYPDTGHDRRGYLYVIEWSEWFKVGFTANPEKRLRAVELSLPTDMTVLLVVNARMSDEARVHAALAEWRTKGEWFRATPGSREAIRGYVERSLR